MKLIVGLGNPGKQYHQTRHNMGFLVLDRLADKLGADLDKEAFHGNYGRFKYLDEDIFLLKPLTFMNLSGVSVHELSSYFNISIEDIVIIFDDLALEPGKIRLRASGSSGGHKGIQSIIEQFKTNDIKRIRIGIGEPKVNCIDYVLSKPGKEEQISINQAIDKAVEAIIDFLKNNFHHAMSQYN